MALLLQPRDFIIVLAFHRSPIARFLGSADRRELFPGRQRNLHFIGRWQRRSRTIHVTSELIRAGVLASIACLESLVQCRCHLSKTPNGASRSLRRLSSASRPCNKSYVFGSRGLYWNTSLAQWD